MNEYAKYLGLKSFNEEIIVQTYRQTYQTDCSTCTTKVVSMKLDCVYRQTKTLTKHCSQNLTKHQITTTSDQQIK